MTHSWALSGDLSRPTLIIACVFAVFGLVLLAAELIRARRGRGAALRIALTGALATIALLAAVLRPIAIHEKGTLVGPKVILLADNSRSIDLPDGDSSRRSTLDRALASLGKRATEVRFQTFAFGDGPPRPYNAPEPGRPFTRSDLNTALETIAAKADERPSAIVVLSDGRLDRPSEINPGDAVKATLGKLAVPIHTVALTTQSPPDASIRKVHTAGAAVAHQPFSLRIEVGCTPGLGCENIPVVARELREHGDPTTLATGTANASTGTATIELGVTIERAGTRILEISIKAPEGDRIPDNDKRFVAIDLTRDRVRVLHVAGRPTYDVRALRTWLKSDASVDVVAFFILRTPTDDTSVPSSELALIPFPVDELFSEHLPSFDAVVLQDFNAEPYGLTKHLPSLARYVDKGGGLIMVGGPDAFGPGHYGGTRLADVLPVEIDSDRRARGVDAGTFSPRFTEAGRAAAVLAPLRDLIGEDFPPMPGTNLVGDPRDDAIVLLTHPTLKTPRGAPMPILALGEHGSGRTMTLAIDGSHRLLFSSYAVSAAGRAHGAFWDAMLGWLMRDPRFEPATIEPQGGCLAGEDLTLTLRPLPGPKGEATVKIVKLGSAELARSLEATVDGTGKAIELDAGKLEPGGYSAMVEIGNDKSRGLTTRRDFACEKGGDEWSDPRPDRDRLAAIAKATGGKAVLADDISSLPLPPATQIAAERKVAPILPAWAWSLGAAFLLGAHWITRRRDGLA